MIKLKKNIGKLDLNDLKKLFNSKQKEVREIVIDQLHYLSKYGKTNKISKESFELCKDKLNINQLYNLSKYGKTYKISKESKKLLSVITNKEGEFNTEDYM